MQPRTDETLSDGSNQEDKAVKTSEQVNRSKRKTVLTMCSELVGPVCLVLDVVCWLLAYLLMLSLRRNSLFLGLDAADGFKASVWLVQFVALALCLFIVGGYDRRTNFLSLGYMSEHLITLLAAAILGGLCIYAGAAYTQALRPSRAVFLLSLAVFAPLSLVTRRTLRAALHTHFARSYFVVLGAGEQARHFYRSYVASPNRERLRFVDPTPDCSRTKRSIDETNPAAPLIEENSLEKLTELASQSSGIIVAEGTQHLPPSLVDWLTRLHYEETPVYTLETFYEHYWRRVPVQAIDPIWPLQVHSELTSVSPYSHAKRLSDIVAAGGGLLLLSPLFLVLGLLVAWETGSPVFFRQTRVGRDRCPFSLLKFRSMYVRPPDEEGSLYTGTRDPRITKVGFWLRKLRLDELPQLWNVMLGNMSLIGPRAEWDRLVDRYETAIPYYHFRHLVKPGITGWAQVNYPYGASQEDALQKLKYDLYYIRHYSLRLDAMIVLKTLHIMIWGKGQ